MNPAARSAREVQPRRFYAPDYRRRLRDAGQLSRLSASANVVLAALCDRANAAGVAWPSVETIAKDYGLGESTVRRAVGELVAVGLVLAVRRSGKVSRYVLATPAMLTEPGAQGSRIGSDPSRIGTSPLPNWAPNMPSDHDQDHQEQHDNAEVGALVVVGKEPSTDERPTATPPANDSEDTTPIALLEPDLADRAREVGLQPARITRYGAERVRQVLDALEAERTRKTIGNPAGWAMKALSENWAVPAAPVQRSFNAGSTVENMPPEGTCWARDRETGVELEVLDVNATRVQLAGGVAVPSHRWSAWEWLVAEPGAVVARVDAPAKEVVDVEKRATLARITTWASIRSRSAVEVEAKLAAVGLTIDKWEAYKATRTNDQEGA